MKLVEINGTAYDIDKIIGVDSLAKEEEHDAWYFIVYIRDGIEEIVVGEDVEDTMTKRTALILELTKQPKLTTDKIHFSQIKDIIDKWTIDCNECTCREVEEDDEIDDGVYPYEACCPDCSTYYAKKIKEEIMSLIGNVEIRI